MDSRDYEAEYGSDHEGFDEKKMTLTYKVYNEDGDEEFLAFPATFEVCDLCSGKGTHVNPSIDCQGLTQEDFDEDPDFREDYFSGRYDEVCYRCHGKRVEPEINDHVFTKQQKEDWKRVEDMLSDRADDRRTQEAERRMAC